MSYPNNNSFSNAFNQIPTYFQNQSQYIPQINSYWTTPILTEVSPSEKNIPKQDEKVEEICTTECHSDSCKCNIKNDYDDNNDCDNINKEECENKSEDDTENDTEDDTKDDIKDDTEDDIEDDTKKIHSEICECDKCFTYREKQIKKIQQELEQKIKFQREFRERLEKEKMRKIQEEKDRIKKEREEKEKQFKTEKRKDLVEKINKLVSEYNEQSKKCDQLLKTYNTENIKLGQLNTEYYKLKYQLDTIDNKYNYNDDFTLNHILFPFLDLLRR